MSGIQISSFTQRNRSILQIAAAVVVVGAVGAFLVWFLTCPCDRMPGGYLMGEQSDQPVADWSFANDVTLCQIQISAGLLPHSINLNCMATPAGDLYLSCSQCETKRWSNAVLENGTARLRLDETVYPVTLTRVLDGIELDGAWGARVTKLNTLPAPANPAPAPGTPRPGHWWSFRVVSR